MTLATHSGPGLRAVSRPTELHGSGPVGPGALPAEALALIQAEARAELAAEFATEACERLRKELAYAEQTAKRAALDAVAARRRRRAAVTTLERNPLCP